MKLIRTQQIQAKTLSLAVREYLTGHVHLLQLFLRMICHGQTTVKHLAFPPDHFFHFRRLLIENNVGSRFNNTCFFCCNFLKRISQEFCVLQANVCDNG